MTSSAERSTEIRSAIDRARTAMNRMSSVGRGTATTRATLLEGLACRVDDGRWSFVADMSEKAGGRGEGPDPGVYGRAGLASCLAVGYAMWAAHEDVLLDSLTVEVQADYDARAEYGIGDAVPGYEALRWTVHVTSPAPEAEVRRVLEIAEARSPWLALLRDARRLERDVRFEAPGAPAGEPAAGARAAGTPAEEA